MENQKIAVITGAGGVLCSCFARFLASQGYSVMLLDLNENAAAAAAKQITDAGLSAYAYAVNVLDRAMLTKVKNRINSQHGSVSLLINGAGGNSPKCTTDKEKYFEGDIDSADVKSFFDLDAAGFEFVFNLNCLGTVIPTQVFAQDMLCDGGCIINISSMNAYRPLTKIPAYSAAKSAVSNLTQWLAVHFAPVNIRVNAIAPGFFVTAQNKSLLFDNNGNPTERTKKILAATPMARFGRPEELLGTLGWLCDGESSGFVTGITVPVDGGFSAYSGV